MPDADVKLGIAFACRPEESNLQTRQEKGLMRKYVAEIKSIRANADEDLSAEAVTSVHMAEFKSGRKKELRK